jgi:hypothetical protein
MLTYENTLKTIGLQFFAEGGQDKPNEDPNGEDPKGGDPRNNPPGEQNRGARTFTQEEVNRMMRDEKESAKKSLLRELGVDDAKTAKEGLAKYREILDKDKTDAERAKEGLAVETKAKGEAERRALLAEAKVEALSAGCNPTYLDDLITLATSRVTEDKDLSAVIKEMKGDQKYKTFFGTDHEPEDKGTGGGGGYRRKQGSDKKGSLGSRLGEQAAKSAVKNPYFNN